MNKKKKKLICQYCGAKGKLDTSLRVYKKDYGKIWICSNYPSCDAYVGCHLNTEVPKGWMANAELRVWRKETHKVFDTLWKEKIRRLDKERGFNASRKYSVRSAAYSWLATELEIDGKYCHIAMFDIEMCQRAIEICEPYFEKITNRRVKYE